MKLLSSVLLIVAFESLFANYASSQCQPLNRTLFHDSCISAGYNMSEFSRSRPQGELASLTTSMQSKFENCSASFSTLMACSVHVPKCSSASSARLPCKEVCRNFVRGCQHGSSENEGLVALFRGLCELLPSDQCLPKSNPFNNTGAINVTCQSLDIPQCKYAGYSLTSVSSSYQKMVESSKIFQSSDIMNSTLRKIICMEVAPPCDNQNNRTLRVPCKSTCEAAFNESTSQFLAVFKSRDYCSVFPPNKPMDGQEYCSLQAWPGAGYWPSDLWRSIGTSPTAPGSVSTPVPTTKAPVTTLVSTTKAPVSTSAPTTVASGNVTTHVPTTTEPGNVTTPVPTTKAPVTTLVPTTVAFGNVTTPVSTTNPPGNVTTPVPTTEASGNVSSPVPTTKAPVTTPVPTTTAPGNVTTPVPTTTAPGNVSTPVPTTTAPGNVSTPVTTTTAPGNVSTPVPTTTAPGNVSTPVTTSTASGNVTTPVTTTEAPGNVTTPVTSTEAPGNVTTPVTTTEAPGNVSTPAKTTNTHAVSDTTGKVPSTENHSSTSGMSSTTESGTKESSDVQANKGGKISAGAISGIVLGVIVGLVAIAVVVVLFRRYKRRRNQYSHSLMVNMDEL